MRIRSCQLVYLLLLLCSVQRVDTRALGMLVADSAGTVASAQETSPQDVGQALAALHAEPRSGTAESGTLPAAQPPDWAGPSAHASAMAAFTGFARG